MLESLKPLIDSGIINEDTQQAITEAWESKLNEAREQIRAEMREEFAGRYEHDKGVMVEALDKMVSEGLQQEIAEFVEEKQSLAADRVRYNRHMKESAQKFEQFLTSKLVEEVKELREDRKQYKNAISKLEQFTVKALAEEIQEFAQDKRELVETKVRLISEAKGKLADLQKKFIAQSAELVKESIGKSLTKELTQLKEDIQVARENNFGRRLFEAFASEFAITHLNENKEISKLRDEVMTAKKIAVKQSQLAESREREVRILKESQEREKTLASLLKPLNAQKQDVMIQLLESVQTEKLKSAYEKYLPAVLNGSTIKEQKTEKSQVLTESRKEVTGDKTAKKVSVETQEETNVIELKRLAGLK
jgi:hypothetical protein